MLHQRIIFIFAVLSLLILSLDNAKGQNTNKECNIRRYNYYTNLAELQILDSTYQKALCYYDSAFCYSKSPFYRDRFNNMVCNALVGNYEKCRTALIYLLEKGMNRVLVLNNPAFSSFLVSSYGRDIHELDLRPTYDTSLKQKYDSLIIADQYFRNLKHHHYREFYSDTIDKIDSSNVEFMNGLIRNHGWPTIDNVGIPPNNYPQYQLIIMHLGDPKYQYYNYAEDIHRAYENGLIEPDRALFLIAWSNNYSTNPASLITVVYDSLDVFVRDSLSSYCHTTGFLNLNADEISKVAKERELLGMESISDLQRKALYSLKDKRFNLEFIGGMDFWAFTKLKDYQHASSNLILIN
jgi:hypothetical protein